jgi:glycosyltransferase involved in cell wall biosynthesis
MKLQFLNKLALDVVSGGNIYNKIIIEGLKQKNITVDYNTSHTNKKYDFAIVDSLYMNSIDRETLLNQNKQILALIHQIPSLSKDALLFYKTNAKFIVTGKPTKRNLINNWEIDNENISIIRPGISKNWKPKIEFSDKPKHIIIVANLVKNKGFEMFIRTLKRINHLNLTFHIVSNNELDKTYADPIINQIINTSNKVKFHFNLNRDEVYEQLIKSDVFLSLSESETFGMALFEALNLNIPSIAYKTGDYNYFSSFKNYLAHNKYLDDCFIDTIETWINNPSIYKSYCNTSNQIKRSWDDTIEEFSKCLQKNTFVC